MEDKLIPLLIGFICGLIVWTYIHSIIIKRKVDKLLKAIGEAYCESRREIHRLEQDKDFYDLKGIEEMKLCKAIFGILHRAICNC